MLIRGIDVSGNYVNSTVEFYLADYRYADNSLDYLVDEWTWVDLSGLGAIAQLEFSLEGSDMGMFGLNTPAYFAMDNLTLLRGKGLFVDSQDAINSQLSMPVAFVPEPATLLIMGLGGILLARKRR